MKHPKKKLLWSFKFSGVGTLTPFEGMANSARFTILVKQIVTRDMQKAFSEGEVLFQQDLAPCCMFKQFKKVFHEAEITI